jgi:hypothetical protein
VAVVLHPTAVVTVAANREFAMVIPSGFEIGDHVRPKSEWKDDPNRIPTGVVRRIEPWGDGGALYVGAERRAFAAYVFEQARS